VLRDIEIDSYGDQSERELCLDIGLGVGPVIHGIWVNNIVLLPLDGAEPGLGHFLDIRGPDCSSDYPISVDGLQRHGLVYFLSQLFMLRLSFLKIFAA
jgi:hypothetical protein